MQALQLKPEEIGLMALGAENDFCLMCEVVKPFQIVIRETLRGFGSQQLTPDERIYIWM
jgi:hypothetical protein